MQALGQGGASLFPGGLGHAGEGGVHGLGSCADGHAGTVQAEGGGDGIAPAGQVVGEVGIGVFHGEVGGLQGYVCGGTACGAGELAQGAAAGLGSGACSAQDGDDIGGDLQGIAGIGHDLGVVAAVQALGEEVHHGAVLQAFGLVAFGPGALGCFF